MKDTGIVRRIDELGRVVIPKEARQVLGIKPGTSMEVFVEGNQIILQKYRFEENNLSVINNVIDSLSKTTGLTTVYFNNEEAVIAKGKEAEIFCNAVINAGICKKIETRKAFVCSAKSFADCDDKLLAYISPLILDDDLIGAIAIIFEEKISASEIKLTEMACDLFIKQVG